MSKQYKAYMASWDVFSPQADKLAQNKRELLESFGINALCPVDSEVDFNKPKLEIAKDIFNKNLALLDEADFVIADINPFRGYEQDSGVCFEIGHAYASGKPVYGIIRKKEQSYKDRMVGLIHERDGVWYDSNGYKVEDFALNCNLMINLACDQIFESLTECLEWIKEYY